MPRVPAISAPPVCHDETLRSGLRSVSVTGAVRSIAQTAFGVAPHPLVVVV
jgi:hypothetical protein